MQKEFTRYETARILGARALQIAMNAPLLIKISKEDLEKINFDAIKIAEIELESGVLPISVNKPLPGKNEDKLKRVKEVKLSEKELIESEKEEEKDIAEKGEIMELANPEDEVDEGIENGDSQ
ncbi:DNA-directed RNA polymerase subunit K [Candidatus Pacearchaeota archaeon]|nr:DNA-directed RNA polymerase subunit K [Candidatus Pacearchaeota archaeon]